VALCTIEKANVAINKLVQEGRLGKHMQRINTRQTYQPRTPTCCILRCQCEVDKLLMTLPSSATD